MGIFSLFSKKKQVQTSSTAARKKYVPEYAKATGTGDDISEKRNVLLPGNVRKTKIQSLIPAKIDPDFGIEAISFDDTIREMNSIQESIMFSSYGHTDA